jgi:hypothetical protein
MQGCLFVVLLPLWVVGWAVVDSVLDSVLGLGDAGRVGSFVASIAVAGILWLLVRRFVDHD